jgi:hypothetical protein
MAHQASVFSSQHIVQADGLLWLREHPAAPQTSVVTSLPDLSELPQFEYVAWRAWFIETARAVLHWLPDQGCAIFYQSDTLYAGAWVDKAQLVLTAAEAANVTLAWHKIVCRRAPGTHVFGRASYSHMLCLVRGDVPRLRSASPDVLPDDGAKSWTRGMGSAACELACVYLRDATHTRLVVDPFCGRGSVLAVASRLGFDVLGVELSAKPCRAARAANPASTSSPGPSKT